MILGIDSSIGTAVALIDPDGVLRAEAASADPRGHAEVIGPLLARVLGDAAAAPAEITAVAVGMGPGPFTGLRVGIAAARAFALGRGIPVLPVPSHDAVALGALLAAAVAGEEPPPFAVVTDARRRELAYSVYDGLDADGLAVRLAGPALAPLGELDERLADLRAVRRDAAAVPAAMLALTASRAFAAGRTLASHDALYLRAPDVTPPVRAR